MVEMTSEDWDAAQIYADLYSGSECYKPGYHQRIGEAFARHRIAAEQRGKLEGVRLAIEAETRFYLDCEFDGHNGPLLSIALVKEDGVSIHIQTDAEPRDPWVIANVMPIMDAHKASAAAKVYLNEVGGVIRAFIGDCACPIIVADSPVDIGRFCRALSTGSDGKWASADYPAMRFEVHNVNCYPTDLPGAVQHNAWWDAMALRRAISRAKIVGEG